MNNILITGGTGALGQRIIERLLKTNGLISVITTKEKTTLPQSVQIINGNLTNEDSIADALSNADIIIHCASNPLNAREVDLEGSKKLLSTVNKKKIRHFIYVSIVGVDKNDFPYYQVKREVEQLIEASDIPFTIVRATQFHDFVLYRMIKPYDTGTSLEIPAGLKFQSIAISEVADKVAGLVPSLPKNETLIIGGPEVLDIETMAQAYLNTLGRTDVLQTKNMDGERFEMLRSGINLCKEHIFGVITWQQYLTGLLKHDNL